MLALAFDARHGRRHRLPHMGMGTNARADEAGVPFPLGNRAGCRDAHWRRYRQVARSVEAAKAAHIRSSTTQFEATAMLAAIAAAWKWFLGSTFGRWIVGVGTVLAAIAVLAYTAFLKGKHAQSDEDKAARSEEEAAFGRLAQQTRTDASAAAEKVQADAAKQPSPDPVKRDALAPTF